MKSECAHKGCMNVSEIVVKLLLLPKCVAALY